MLEVTSANFATDIESDLSPILLDFYADWCGPCRMMAPTLHTLETEFQGKVKFCKISADNEHEICQKFGIRGLPTLVLLVNGHKLFKVGAQSADSIRAWIGDTLAAAQNIQ